MTEWTARVSDERLAVLVDNLDSLSNYTGLALSMRAAQAGETVADLIAEVREARARVAELDEAVNAEMRKTIKAHHDLHVLEAACAAVAALREALQACVDCEITNVSSGHPPFPALCASHRAEAQITLADTAQAAQEHDERIRALEREACAKVAIKVLRQRERMPTQDDGFKKAETMVARAIRERARGRA